MVDNKEINRLVEDFLKRRYLLDMGKNKLASYLKSTPENIVMAKKLARKSMITDNKSKNFTKLPKILIFDIETSPMISYHFGHWNQNISLDQVIENPIMLTWSAKWLFSSEVISEKITTDEVLRRDDKRIVTALWNLINGADIVVAHFGNKFDIPMMNSRFIINGLQPTTSYKSIDTKAVASKHFRFPSNKLDAIAGYFGFGKKIKTDFLLWRGCMEGNADKIEEMRVYNVQDVIVLEEVYLKLRPYIRSHPNVGLYIDSEVPGCANCGCEDLTLEDQYYTNTNKYDVYRCTCGALSRVRNSSLTKEDRKNLIVSLAN